jgi:hypothetical protein
MLLKEMKYNLKQREFILHEFAKNDFFSLQVEARRLQYTSTSSRSPEQIPAYVTIW